ncbi:hypothetical protein BcepSauron_148 [Burkholderia phage BcepSauron]|uniref:Uncharacterized protein n=1 Tax=Burkholderia phage BcepSauron TaxID=2530033 RepID=A0A482MLL6_9CAUD|nr:hypothetical protein H1O17_gp148 [Burkholderia phage BcepSauron]QBQ74528.1 hypothetical protein BcepSauron_148 [Burkholderia phage BcepSauron]
MGARRAGYEAYWDGVRQHENPESGVARSLWLNGWERARDLDDSLNPELGFEKCDPAPSREGREISPAMALFLTSPQGRIRFVPSEWVCATSATQQEAA